MATDTIPVPTSVPRSQGLLADPRWQLVERITASPHFAKSGRLRAFLLFVSEEALLGREDQLNEQRIGINVFGRKVDYDSADDNIVRSHASRLRQRLEAYFLQEGKSEALHLSLPRGGYVPKFAPAMPSISEARAPNGIAGDPPSVADIAVNPEAETTASSAEPSARNRIVYGKNFFLVLALLVMTSVAGYEWKANRVATERGRSKSVVMRSLWQQVFAAGRRTMIVPADSSLVLFENLTDTNVTLRNYMDKTYLGTESVGSLQTPDATARRIAHRRLTSIADVELVSNLLQVPESLTTPPVIRFARDVQVSDLKGINAVLIGAKESDPWLAMFEDRRNFTIDDDQATRTFSIRNRNPKAGEPAVYYSTPDDPDHRAYAVIALVPNLDNSGVVLIVEGTSIAGTQAAADFLTASKSGLEAALEPSYTKLGYVPQFEILLETTNLNGSAPQSHVVAVRTGS